MSDPANADASPMPGSASPKCDPAATDSPELPPEILTVVFHHFRGLNRELLRCSLVCRTWLLVSRSLLGASLFAAEPASRLAQLLECPENTLGPSLSSLGISYNADLLVPLLPRFTHLQSFYWHDATSPITADVPALPSLTILSLFGLQFCSYSVFFAFLSGSPLLRHLGLADITCGGSDEEGMVKFPPLELATLQLSFHRENSCDTHIVFAMRPRKLILRVWRPEYRTMVSKYLVHLGPVLQALELSRLPVEDILAFRFFANINLTRLILDNALRYDGSSENPETHVLVNPILPPLLSHIAEQAPLRHLILRVTITEPPRVTPSSPLILHMIAKRRVDSSGWLPLANLLEVLDRPPLSSMTIPIEFPMGGAPIVLSNSGLRRVRRGFEQRMRGVMPDERFIAFHGN